MWENNKRIIRRIARKRGMAGATVVRGILGFVVHSRLHSAKFELVGIDLDFATLVRNVVIISILGLFVWFTGKFSNLLLLSSKFDISCSFSLGYRSF